MGVCCGWFAQRARTPVFQPRSISIRFYCSKDDESTDEEFYSQLLEDSGGGELQDVHDAHEEFVDKHTHLVGTGDNTRRILNKDAPSSDPESEFNWDDVDSNLDNGLYDDNK